MPKKLTDIEVYLISEELANKIWGIVKYWHYFEKETLGKQLVRAADSISANIAEAYGRYHYKDRQKFGYYARGSFEETKSWRRFHLPNLCHRTDKCGFLDLISLIPKSPS
jgi:four helix bundle protein